MNWQANYRAPARLSALPELRRRVQTRLRKAGVARELIDRAGLLVSELAHNAVDHSDGAQEVRVEIAETERGLRLAVECEANRDWESLMRGIDASSELPSPDSERGRGLWMVLNLSRDLQVSRQPGGWIRLSLLLSEAKP